MKPSDTLGVSKGERNREMIILFTILMISVFGNLIGFAFKATWGIFKVLLTLVFFPLILVGMVLAGAVYIAVPVLIVAGIISVIPRLAEN